MLFAISKTLDETRALAIANLQSVIQSDDILSVPSTSTRQKTSKNPSLRSSNTLNNNGSEAEHRRILQVDIAQQIQFLAKGIGYKDIQRYIMSK